MRIRAGMAVGLVAASLVAAVGLAAAVVSVVSGDPGRPEGVTLIEGDSVTSQYVRRAQGDREFPEATFHVGPGWEMDACVSHLSVDCEPPLRHVQRLAAEAPLDTVVYLLGTNDSSFARGDGWEASDGGLWEEGLEVGDDDTCIVVVLPWLTEGAPAEHRAEIDEARAAIRRLADERDVPVVDWRPFTERPNVMAPDGIHLASGDDDTTLSPEAYAARRDVIREALGRCPRP